MATLTMTCTVKNTTVLQRVYSLDIDIQGGLSDDANHYFDSTIL